MDIITKTTNDAIRLLNATRAKYIIVTANGEIHTEGDLKLAAEEPKRTRVRAKSLPYGSYSAIARPYVNTPIGEVIVLDVPKGSTLEETRSGVTVWLLQKWGKDSLRSSLDKDKNQVQVLRIA